MMSVLLHPRFYLSMIATSVLLLLCGLGVAYFVIEPPYQYYRTTFYSWPIPRDWDCDMEGTETICRPGKKDPGEWKQAALAWYCGDVTTGFPCRLARDDSRNMIIIATAKIRGSIDTYDQYREYLMTPRVWTDKTGKQITSEVLYVRESKLGDHIWMDGAHMNSELENYQTRYLATYTSRLAVLATYAIHKDYVADYEAILNRSFDRMQIYESSTATVNR